MIRLYLQEFKLINSTENDKQYVYYVRQYEYT